MYALFYKDKDGFILPVLSEGAAFVFDNKQQATRIMEDLLAVYESKLNPIVVYKKKHFFSREMVRAPELPEHLKELYKQISLTIFVSKTKLVNMDKP